MTDKSGNHVHGLTCGDFQILENGQEQKISSCEEVRASQAPLNVAAPKAGEFSNVNLTKQAHTAVVICPGHGQHSVSRSSIRATAVGEVFGRAHGRKSTGRPGSNQWQGDELIHGLTSDPSLLIAALKKVNGEIPRCRVLTWTRKPLWLRGSILPTLVLYLLDLPQWVVRAAWERSQLNCKVFCSTATPPSCA